MNISTDRLVANDGSGLDDRPAYVREALDAGVQCGYLEGRPVVAPPDGRPEHVPLDSDVRELYDHYKRGESLLLPEAGDFLRRLFESEHVESVADAASEVNSDERTVRKAADLHGIDTPLQAKDSEGAEGDDMLSFPSGETVRFDPLHPLVLAQLLSDGMSVEESAQYLSAETGGNYTPSDVREAAQQHALLEDGNDSTANLIPDRERTVTAGDGDVASTPW